ncbi:MAG: LptF/LptG family permease [Chlamydiales bacterium]
MLPLLWKTLLKRYFQVITLSVLSFIAVLLLLRLKEIATFATLSFHIKDITLFILYQIPYILPFAISISSLLSSLVLTQSLSRTCELTAMRSFGISLEQILAPLFACGLTLSLLVFLTVSELTPHARFLTQDLIYKTTVGNPLILLEKNKRMKLTDAIVEMECEEKGVSVKDFLFALNDKKNDRITLVLSKKLKIERGLLRAKDVSILTHVANEEGKDHLLIENAAVETTKARRFAEKLQGKGWNLKAEHLPLKWMLIDGKLKHKRKDKQRTKVELARRLSLSLSAFTMTVIGAIFGMEIGRVKKKRGIFFACLFAAIILFSFIAAKSFAYSGVKSALCQFIPQAAILLLCSLHLKRVKRGSE